MAKIFYSMAGEGRGHATRVEAVVEAMRHEHQFVLFAPHQAYDLLAPHYANSAVEVRQIPGLIFHYKDRRLNYLRTTYQGWGYLRQLPRLINELAEQIRQEKPDLIITDFEPALPRAAQRCGVPFISLNHQHFLVACDFRDLPWALRTYAWYMSWVVRAYYSGQAKTIICSFYAPPLKPGYEKEVVLVGPLLRPAVLQATPRQEAHLVAYLRGRASRRILDLLATSPAPVRVYGIDGQSNFGPLQFCQIDEKAFVEDLATCNAFVGAAGNQTLSEALYLGKPCFVFPEKSHHEQLINAHLLRAAGAGNFAILETANQQEFQTFLQERDRYRQNLEPTKLNGLPLTIATLNEFLKTTTAETLVTSR